MILLLEKRNDENSTKQNYEENQSGNQSEK